MEGKSEIPVDNVLPLVRYGNSIKELPTKKNHLTRALLDKLPAKSGGGKTPRIKLGTGEYVDAFNKLLQQLQGGTNYAEEIFFSSWNPNTLRTHLTYFHNRILPELSVLAEHGKTFDAIELETLRSKLEEKTSRSGRSKKNMKSVQNTVNSELSAGEHIYSAMRTLSPALPEIHLHSDQRIIQYQPEYAKSLPAAVRYHLIGLLTQEIERDPQFAFHAILMFVCGLRDAEACAALEKHIIFYSMYAMLCVESQIKDGAPSNILKTSNAYRLIVVPFWGMCMLHRCIVLIQEQGDCVQPYLNLDRFSGRLKHMIMKSGCKEEFFRAARVLMDTCPDIIDGEICTDINSYILRRDYASRAKNICGMTTDEIDALLGHKRQTGNKRGQVNYANNDEQVKTSRKLERFVFDPKMSLNPEFSPIKLEADKDLNLIPYNAYTFCNLSDQPLWIELSVRAKEPDEKITLIAPGAANPHVDYYSRSFSPDRRELIGRAYSVQSTNEEDFNESNT